MFQDSNDQGIELRKSLFWQTYTLGDYSDDHISENPIYFPACARVGCSQAFNLNNI